MKQDEAVSTILGCSISGYYKWKKQNRLIINLLEKYFTKEDLKEFIEIGKITRIEDNKDQELLNNEASKIYNHFISSLYYKDKNLLKMFLLVINNANKNSLNLNLNFIDLVFEAEGEKENKIKLIKEFNKISQNNNILFFYSIKFMVQNGLKNTSLFSNKEEKDKKEDLAFIINYMQFFLEIFYKIEYIKWEEFDNNESIHLRDYEYNIYDDELLDFPLPSLEDLSNKNEIPNDDYYNINEYKEESNDFNYIKFISSLKNYKTYLESLVPENDTIRIKFKIDENSEISTEELLRFKKAYDI